MLLEIINSLPSNVLAGLAGAFILWLLKTLLQKYADSNLNKKYNLSGEYLTRYEDLDPSNEIIWRKALATLTQKGASVTGTTKNLSDDKAWFLSLTLTKQKYLTGTYSSENPHDPGLGTIILEIASPIRLEGIWAGYDSVNKSIQSGRYVFLKSLSPSILQLNAKHLNHVLALFGKCLGEKYITPHQLGEYATPGERKKGFVAVVQGKVIGAVTCEIVTLDSIEKASLIPLTQLKSLLPEISFHNGIGLIKSLAVYENFRGRGVASALVKAAVEWLASQEATKIITVAWVSNGTCNAQGVLESCGFYKISEIPQFWHSDSLEKGYLCPDCGNPCRCSAAIFVS